MDSITAKRLSPTVVRFVEDMGNVSQSLGLGRVVGQVYAYLYFSPESKNLVDMQDALGISKGSASTGVRVLEQWGAVRKVWVKGDRKDYYQASDWFGRILKNVMLDLAGKKMASYMSLMAEIEEGLAQIEDGDPQGKFIRARIGRLREFQRKAAAAWDNPLVKGFLK